MEKTISFRVTQDFDRRLRIEAAKRCIDRSTLIRNMLLETLKTQQAGMDRDNAADRGTSAIRD
jgi:predicted transcriptional regulator